MRRYFSVLLCCLAMTSAQGQSAASAKVSSGDLAGAWRLVKVETLRPNGEVIYPFYGKHPEGLIVYDRSGWMSVQIVSDPKPTVPKADGRGDFLNAPANEKAAAADGYYAYYGRWSFDAATQQVTHHLKDSLYPGERGTEFVRSVTLQGGRLTLIAKTHEMGEDHQRVLVWERAETSKP
jgi:hypothetical protein